jgi:hypothetical protein
MLQLKQSRKKLRELDTIKQICNNAPNTGAFFMIIGICGFIGSGKDTAADYLQNFHEFRRESFASTLKDAVAAVFGWDRTMLEGRTKQAREWREQRDDWWSNRLGIDITPRWVLQYWGTEVCRKGFHDDIWIASMENKLRSSQDNIVISDCRFPNEIKSIKNAGGKVIWVKRGELPEWYNVALDCNNGSESAKWELINRKIHASETSWVGTDFDAIIDNNGTIDDLYSQIKNLALVEQVSTAI